MAYQIQINFRDFGGLSENERDLLAYETTQFIQSRIPSKVFGYGIVEVDEPERSVPRATEPATAEVIAETSSPIRMLHDALL